jgi:hypothetical protein
LRPIALARWVGGAVAVLDVGKSRVLFLDTLGRELSSLITPSGFPTGMHAAGDGALVVKVQRDYGRTATFWEVRYPDSTFRQIASVRGAGVRPSAEDYTCMFCAWLPGRSGAVLVGAPDTVYAVRNAEGSRIGAILATREVGARKRTEEELRELERALSRNPVPRSPAPEVSPYDRRLVDIAADSRNRLWLLVSNAGAARVSLDVFTPVGAFLGSAALPRGVRGFRIHNLTLVAFGEDALGNPALWIFDIER